MNLDHDRIRDALNHISSDDRETWVMTGMAIKSELGEEGYQLWDDWSQRCDSYRERDAVSAWKSFRPGGGIGIGSLFHVAKQHGFDPRGSNYTPPTAEQIEAHREAARIAAQKHDQEQQENHRKAADAAKRVFRAALPARSDHPYLVRKRIAPTTTMREIPANLVAKELGYAPQCSGEPLTGRTLVIPVSAGEKLQTLELIDESGRKSALAGGAKSGCFWSAQRLSEVDATGIVLMAEGVATATSLRIGTGLPAFAALSCHNLPRAVKTLRGRYPQAKFVVCGDLGIGAKYAHEAALVAGGLVAFPGLSDGEGTDFNDQHVRHGAEAVKASVGNASAPGGGASIPATASAPTVKSRPATSAPAYLSRRLSDIVAKPIAWLWPGRIASGKVSMIAGHPGLGKSQLTAAIAAVVSTGGEWPVERSCAEMGSVIFLNAEDDAADTIRPRLEAAGADLTRCEILDAVVDGYDKDGNAQRRGFSLKLDLRTLELMLSQRRDCALVVIDPISAYLSGVDSHTNADVRAVLAPLSELAAKYGVAVIVVSHLNKASATSRTAGEAQLRVSGSLAFVAASRAAHIVVVDPEDEDRRLFLTAKNNNAKHNTGLAFVVESYTLDSGIETSRVMWERELVTISAEEAMAPPPDESEQTMTQDAENLLKCILMHGRVNSRDIKRQATESGISDKALRRARTKMAIQVEREGSGAEMKSFWFRPGTPFVPSNPIHAPVEWGTNTPRGTNEPATDLGEPF